MSLAKPDSVDAIGIDKVTGVATLAILDSWDWQDEHGHLGALQKKLGAYFDFIEGGGIWKMYPDAKGRQIAIDVIGRYPLPSSAVLFLNKAAEMASSAGIVINIKTA